MSNRQKKGDSLRTMTAPLKRYKEIRNTNKLIKKFVEDYEANGFHEKKVIDFSRSFMEINEINTKILTHYRMPYLSYRIMNESINLGRYVHQLATLVFKKSCCIVFNLGLSFGYNRKIYDEVNSLFPGCNFDFATLNMKNVYSEYCRLSDKNNITRKRRNDNLISSSAVINSKQSFHIPDNKSNLNVVSDNDRSNILPSSIKSVGKNKIQKKIYEGQRICGKMDNNNISYYNTKEDNDNDVILLGIFPKSNVSSGTDTIITNTPNSSPNSNDTDGAINIVHGYDNYLEDCPNVDEYLYGEFWRSKQKWLLDRLAEHFNLSSYQKEQLSSFLTTYLKCLIIKKTIELKIVEAVKKAINNCIYKMYSFIINKNSGGLLFSKILNGDISAKKLSEYKNEDFCEKKSSFAANEILYNSELVDCPALQTFPCKKCATMHSKLDTCRRDD